MYIYIYIGSICGQQLFRSLRAHQRSSDQMKISKDQSAQTTARAVGIAYRLWLPFSINRVPYQYYIYIYIVLIGGTEGFFCLIKEIFRTIY